MKTTSENRPRWIQVRLGEDFNWWLHRAGEEIGQSTPNRGVLDPRQVQHLAQMLEEYRPYGLRKEMLAAAFAMYAVEAEAAENELRLVSAEESEFTDGADLFALPLISLDGEDAYHDLLDVLAEARVRRLNETHRYAQDCSVMDMDEELAGLDADRYFNADTIHAFDEINEILEWSPAEWDDSES